MMVKQRKEQTCFVICFSKIYIGIIVYAPLNNCGTPSLRQTLSHRGKTPRYLCFLTAFISSLDKRKVSGDEVSVNMEPSQTELLSSWHGGELGCFIITVLTITPRQGSLSASLPACPHTLIIFSFPPPPPPFASVSSSFYQAYTAWFLPWVAEPTQVGVIVV